MAIAIEGKVSGFREKAAKAANFLLGTEAHNKAMDQWRKSGGRRGRFGHGEPWSWADKV